MRLEDTMARLMTNKTNKKERLKVHLCEFVDPREHESIKRKRGPTEYC